MCVLEAAIVPVGVVWVSRTPSDRRAQTPRVATDTSRSREGYKYKFMEPVWPGAAPTIDLSEDGTTVELALRIDQALREWGLFLVCNHGVPQGLIDRMWAFTKAFHALPPERKRALGQKVGHMGYKQSEGGLDARFENAFPEDCAKAKHNQWPDESTDELRGFHETTVAFTKAVHGIVRRILPLLEQSMDLEPGTLADAGTDAQYFLNIRHFPDRGDTAERVCCIRPHTDSGVFTLLPQQDKRGFEICLPDGRWVPVGPPAVGGGGQTWFLVQAGDCLRRWTNHRYVSALHRVVPHPGTGDRYAMPLFWGPGESYPMRPLPGCSDPMSNPERYPEPITYHDYMIGFEARKYSTVSTLTAAQVRAADDNRIDEGAYWTPPPHTDERDGEHADKSAAQVNKRPRISK